MVACIIENIKTGNKDFSSSFLDSNTNLFRTLSPLTKSMLNDAGLLGSPIISLIKEKSPSSINLKIRSKALPSVVFPEPLEPMSITAFLYLKFGLSFRYSPSIVDLMTLFG